MPARAGALNGPAALDRADTDERPTLQGSRVRLAGELRDGPPGIVTGVAGPRARWVLFDGERAPILADLAQLRRLP